MKLHSRHEQVTRAHIDLSEAICEIVKKHDITYGELTNIIGQELCSWSKYQVKDEREQP